MISGGQRPRRRRQKALRAELWRPEVVKQFADYFGSKQVSGGSVKPRSNLVKPVNSEKLTTAKCSRRKSESNDASGS
jgi:hypothetical protein